MNTAGFYKYMNGELFCGPNFVYGAYDAFRLFREERNTYTYPVDGWYWFDSEEEARIFFNIPLPDPNPNNYTETIEG